MPDYAELRKQIEISLNPDKVTQEIANTLILAFERGWPEAIPVSELDYTFMPARKNKFSNQEMLERVGFIEKIGDTYYLNENARKAYESLKK